MRSQPGGVVNARRSPIYSVSEICGYVNELKFPKRVDLKQQRVGGEVTQKGSGPVIGITITNVTLIWTGEK